MSSPVTASTSTSPVKTQQTPIAISVTSPITSSSEPSHPPGLIPDDRLSPPHDDAYWRHLREMWAGPAAESRRPSLVSPASPAFSDDASTIDLEDVDLRSATAHRIRLDLPALIKAQTEAANRPPPAGAAAAAAAAKDNNTLQLPPMPRRGGVVVTTTTTTTARGGVSEPAPPYTRRPSLFETSLSGDAYIIEESEVSRVKKWTYWIPSCKWLFWIGFIFPLLWILGSATLLLGIHHSPATVVENGPSKLTKFINQAQIDEKYRLEREIRWAKRCAWMTAAAFCLIPVIICLAVVLPRTATATTAMATPAV